MVQMKEIVGPRLLVDLMSPGTSNHVVKQTSSHSRNQTVSQLAHEFVTSPFEMNSTVADKELIRRHQR